MPKREKMTKGECYAADAALLAKRYSVPVDVTEPIRVQADRPVGKPSFSPNHTPNPTDRRTGGRLIPYTRPKNVPNRANGLQAENPPKRPISPSAKLRRDYAGFTRIGDVKHYVGEGAYWLACRNAKQSKRQANRSLVQATEEKRAYADMKQSRL